jgi:DNA-binding NtrC family response regulator
MVGSLEPDETVDPSGPRQRAHRLLIVDDEESILFAMRDYFIAHGYAVDCARNHEEATACVVREAYGVVIADLRLSVTRDDDGLDLIGYVRDHSPSTRTILLTAHGSVAIAGEAQRFRVDVVLHKPKPLPEVARIVDRLLAGEG